MAEGGIMLLGLPGTNTMLPDVLGHEYLLMVLLCLWLLPKAALQSQPSGKLGDRDMANSNSDTQLLGCWVLRWSTPLPETRMQAATIDLSLTQKHWKVAVVWGGWEALHTLYWDLLFTVGHGLSNLNQLDSDPKLLPPMCEVSLWSQVQLIMDITKPPLSQRSQGVKGYRDWTTLSSLETETWESCWGTLGRKHEATCTVPR